MFSDKKQNPNIFYITDNNENRLLLKKLLGNGDFNNDINYYVIEINLHTLKWRLCFTFEFLYRTNPEITDIAIIKKLIRKRKIELYLK